jgi:DNA-binding NtrC family response regulator
MQFETKRGKILFIDDQQDAVEAHIQHLRNEGFTNVTYLREISSLNEVLGHEADLIFLDITGVASALDADDEGLSVLEYVKKHRPWTQVVVLSGSDFPASKAKQLSNADLCITKASLTLADLVNITEDQLRHALAPEYRNVKILALISQRIDELNLSWWGRRQLRKLVADAKAHEGDSAYDWRRVVINAKEWLSASSNVATLIGLFAS